MCVYILYIHPEFRIGDCRLPSPKGAKPLGREYEGSTGEHGGAREKQHPGSLKWLLQSQLKLHLLFP